MTTQKEINKCKCACHGTEFNSMKKHAPVGHEKMCCENMNGFIETISQKEINDFNGTWDNESYVAEKKHCYHGKVMGECPVMGCDHFYKNSNERAFKALNDLVSTPKVEDCSENPHKPQWVKKYNNLPHTGLTTKDFITSLISSIGKDLEERKVYFREAIEYVSLKDIHSVLSKYGVDLSDKEGGE